MKTCCGASSARTTGSTGPRSPPPQLLLQRLLLPPHLPPLLALLPENPPRGAGIEIRLYDTDPDAAVARAEAAGLAILQPPTDKPHGLREAYILCPDGYAWVPSRPKSG